MWEYYVSIYSGLLVLYLACLVLGLLIFLVGAETKDDVVWISGLVLFIFSFIFFIFAPGLDYAKRKACEIEKVEYICKEIRNENIRR